MGWKPPTCQFKSAKSVYDFDLNWMTEYFALVETSESEAGKMPVLCDILMKSITLYKKLYKSSHVFRIIPVGKSLNDYRTDYLVGVIEASRQVRMLVLFELKPSLSSYLTNVKVSHLAQALVQGYYALLGSASTIVVALTDIATTHFFKLKLKSTRSRDEVPRNIDLVWYKCLVLPRYPPTRKEDLFQFIEYFHFIINEVL